MEPEPTPKPNTERTSPLPTLEEAILSIAVAYQKLPWLGLGCLSLLSYVFIDRGGRRIQAEGFSPFVATNFYIALALLLAGALLRVIPTYRFAVALKVDNPWLPAFFSLFECVNLIVLIWLEIQALDRLEFYGVKTGGLRRVPETEMARLRAAANGEGPLWGEHC